MSRVLITGMSGTGKSAVLGELSRRGHLTVDTGYGSWVSTEGTWDAERMAGFLAQNPDVFIVGTVENQGGFYDRFDHVVLFSAPLDVILGRVLARATNPYGKAPQDRAEIIANLRTVEPLLRLGATMELDTSTLTTAQLADRLERLVRATP